VTKTELTPQNVNVSSDFMKTPNVVVKNVHTHVLPVLLLKTVLFVKTNNTELEKIVNVTLDISMPENQNVNLVPSNVRLVNQVQRTTELNVSFVPPSDNKNHQAVHVH